MNPEETTAAIVIIGVIVVTILFFIVEQIDKEYSKKTDKEQRSVLEDCRLGFLKFVATQAATFGKFYKEALEKPSCPAIKSQAQSKLKAWSDKHMEMLRSAPPHKALFYMFMGGVCRFGKENRSLQIQKYINDVVIFELASYFYFRVDFALFLMGKEEARHVISSYFREQLSELFKQVFELSVMNVFEQRQKYFHGMLLDKDYSFHVYLSPQIMTSISKSYPEGSPEPNFDFFEDMAIRGELHSWEAEIDVFLEAFQNPGPEYYMKEIIRDKERASGNTQAGNVEECLDSLTNNNNVNEVDAKPVAIGKQNKAGSKRIICPPIKGMVNK